jgi:hypothetical protein
MISDFSSEDLLKISIGCGVACPRETDHFPNLQRSLIQACANVRKGLKPISALLHIRLPSDSLRIEIITGPFSRKTTEVV